MINRRTSHSALRAPAVAYRFLTAVSSSSSSVVVEVVASSIGGTRPSLSPFPFSLSDFSSSFSLHQLIFPSSLLISAFWLSRSLQGKRGVCTSACAQSHDGRRHGESVTPPNARSRGQFSATKTAQVDHHHRPAVEAIDRSHQCGPGLSAAVFLNRSMR